MTAFFVTGAGTEVGKTYVAAALLRAKRAAGAAVRALKPVMSGYDPDNLEESDAGRLLAACGAPVSQDALGDICLYAFAPALAPNAAARQAGVTLSDDRIVAFIRERIAASDVFTLVEGAGGVMSPLTDTLLNADLMEQLGLPAILVAANYLGAISHTLTAAEALDRRGVKLAAVVVSQPSQAAPPPGPMIEELERRAAANYVAAPYGVHWKTLGEDFSKARIYSVGR